MPKSHSKRALEEENRALRQALETERRRVASLERRLSDLQARHDRLVEAERGIVLPRKASEERRSEGGRIEKLRDASIRRVRSYRRRSYVRAVYENFMSSFPARVVTRLVLYLRRLRVVRLALTLVATVGAVLFVTVLSAAALPFMLAGAGVLAVLAALRSLRMNRRLAEALTDKQVRVLIPGRSVRLANSIHGDASFFVRQAREMAASPDEAVLVVSPYLLSSKGLGGKGAFFTARDEGGGVYLLRRHYYFILRRRVLEKIADGYTVVY